MFISRIIDGRIKCIEAEPVIWAGGYGYDSRGSLCIAYDTAGVVSNGGPMCTATGRVCVSTNAVTGWAGGIPVDSSGAMVVADGGTPTVGHAGVPLTADGRVVIDSSGFYLPLADDGLGVVALTLGQGTGSGTFTRATAAWTKLSSGLWTSEASGVARSFYTGLNTAVGSYAGYLSEGQRTNSALHARDATNAAWTKTSITAAKDATGIDGVANSASTLTATGANGTCLQSVTLVSAAKTYSVFVRRKTGTGSVFITLDNDLTRTDITALINSSTYTLVQATQTLANPVLGFKIATSGDAIEVDMNQIEDGASFASTPIPTTTAAVTRNADLLTFPATGNVSATAGTCYAEVSTLWSTSANLHGAVTFENTRGPLLTATGLAATRLRIRDGTNAAEKTGLTDMSTGVRKRASSWGGSALAITGDGLAVATGTFDGNMNDNSRDIHIATTVNAGGTEWFGTIKNVRIWQRQLSDAVLQSLTA